MGGLSLPPEEGEDVLVPEIEPCQEEEELKSYEIKQKSLSAPSEEEKKDDKHPEKRMKAAHLAWEEERLKELKAEYPTLKMS